jgi:hypothetical protein
VINAHRLGLGEQGPFVVTDLCPRDAEYVQRCGKAGLVGGPVDHNPPGRRWAGCLRSHALLASDAIVGILRVRELAGCTGVSSSRVRIPDNTLHPHVDEPRDRLLRRAERDRPHE